MGKRAVFEIEHRLGPGPLGAQLGGLRFELRDREPMHEGCVFHEAVVIAAEEIARDRAAGGFIRLGAYEHAEIGIERDRGLGQEMPDPVRRNIRMVLELAPDGELCGMIGAERKGGDGFEPNVAGAKGVEQFGRQLAEAQALTDVPFGRAEARGDVADRGAAVDQRSHGDEFVRRMHRGADRVFGKRGFDRVRGLFDFAGDPVGFGVDHAFGGELLQDLEAAAAGINQIDPVVVCRVDNQVLQDAFGADAGFELGVLGLRSRGLASIGWGKGKLLDREVADIGFRDRGIAVGLGVDGLRNIAG